MAEKRKSSFKEVLYRLGTDEKSILCCGVLLFQNTDNLHRQGVKGMDIKDVIEKLEDIKNIGQLLEVSLEANEDDPSIIRSVSIINNKLESVIKEVTAEQNKQSGGN